VHILGEKEEGRRQEEARWIVETRMKRKWKKTGREGVAVRYTEMARRRRTEGAEKRDRDEERERGRRRRGQQQPQFQEQKKKNTA
jgi:hypothetical protein